MAQAAYAAPAADPTRRTEALQLPIPSARRPVFCGEVERAPEARSP